jgi:hypothetical protein
MEDQPSPSQPTSTPIPPASDVIPDQPETDPAPADTFGEYLNTPTAYRVPIDEFGQPLYHDHDEFGEWLDRDNL